MRLNQPAYTQYHAGTAGVTDVTVTLPQATQAGAFVVVAVNAGAVATVQIGSSGGTSLTKRTERSLGNVEESCHDGSVPTGTTTLNVHLSAASQSARITVLEFAAAVTFATAVTSNSYITQTVATRRASAAASAVLTGDAVMIGSVVVDNSTTAGARPLAMSPHAELVHVGTATGAGRQFYSAHGIADVKAAEAWPWSGTTGTYRQESSTGNSGLGIYMACWYYTDTSGQPTVISGQAAPNPVVVANREAGDYYTTWTVSSTALSGVIAGYSDRHSVAAGSTINFAVDSGGAAFTCNVYRLAHQGSDLMGARLVASPTCTTQSQPAPTVHSTLGSTSCAWTNNVAWTVPSYAQSGFYVALFNTGSSFFQVPFVVKPAKRQRGKVTVIWPAATAHAYNPFGATSDTTTGTGRSLYGANQDDQIGHRCYAVSFNRPFGTLTGRKQTWFMDSFYGLIQFLEAMGYDLEYYADTDLGTDPYLLNGSRLIVMAGHQEYYSLAMRRCLNNALAARVNLAVFGANIMHWRVRFDSDTNPRIMYCYKDSYLSAGFDGTTLVDPVEYTGIWRDTRRLASPFNPYRLPEMIDILGYFGASGPLNQNLVVPSSYKTLPCWRNSAAGDSTFTSGIGYEADFDGFDVSEPVNRVALSATTFSITTGAGPNGPPYTSTGSRTHHMQLAQLQSGAKVFAAGTWQLPWAGMGRWYNNVFNSGATPVPDLQNFVVCMLADLDAQPTTLRVMQPGTDSTAPSSPGAARPMSAYGLTPVGASCGPIRI
ncbi:N,N-dimethylformamidase beta subunit family domain-containing protein [Parafrankia sp. EUN1f]|uniref:N,N-dimethylformamidase beta subunit family domain-containing protein n=1 Tax=Parafrankia sp. EUN1f TaxID=102897 RepID=UPI0001C46CE1|nr:N,N-dimethylformamidase beta subunit family domain-containing protein [Parafrankia sp. EUN1f]EFC80244.1 hypothetical protein FrEUN1fDRAFT_6638 [Parafrankia sp. EUN1f]